MAYLACFALLALCQVSYGRYVDFDSFQVPAKKSAHDLTDFTSALNGAQRLRYGKRGFDPAVLDNVITLNEVGKRGGVDDAELYDNLVHFMEAGKRSPQFGSLSKLAESLNGAERLRYG